MRSEPLEPDIILPNVRQRRGNTSRIWWVVAGAIFLIFIALHNLIPVYTDWLWFREVGYTQVFTTTLIAKTALYLVFGFLFFVLFFGNVWAAIRMAPEATERFLRTRLDPQLADAILRWATVVALCVSLFLSLWAGRIAAEAWPNALLFLHGHSFGVRDPVFNKDVSFYVFQAPFLNYLYQFFIFTLVLTTLAVVVIHVADRSIESWQGLPSVRPGVRAQILLLLALAAFCQAFGTRLSAYDLLQSDNQFFTGAGYTDVHYRLLALNVEIVVLILTGLACLVTIPRSRHFKAPLFGATAWLACIVVLGGVVPSLAQTLTVNPNQLGLERSYIARNIRFTRLGYGLQNVRQIDNFPADESLTAAQLEQNRATLNNVRLWDYQFVGKVYEQIHTIKPYYKFRKLALDGSEVPNIDIDRYRFGSSLRQVILAARELDPSALPPGAQTWQNRRLSFTHGYGLVMSPVNKSVDGDPEYFIQGFPPQSSGAAADLKVTRPQIYFGELAQQPVYVDTQQQEFDYPSTGAENGGQDHYTAYAGSGGVRIGNSFWRKLAFAARFGDWNLLLADNLTPQTRVLFRRDIRDRVHTAAPFLQQDGDPYLVVDPATGHLVWIVDCYTLSDRYPYSTAHEMSIDDSIYEAPNYIRNSVKATVDAYTGKVDFYLVDPADPIARSYASIFPGLIKPMSSLPASLVAHLRYPEDLFRVQRSVYATYHVDDPTVFYRKDDVWNVPVEPGSDDTGEPQPMEPYYVIMRLPDLPPAENAPAAQNGANSEEFILMSPLAPLNKEYQNILGWMCARCDPAHYGQLILYRFPQQASVLGPGQIEQRINSDKVISPQLTLLRGGGSTASLGNLLVIPVDRSLLYIVPLYVEASTSATKLPKLQKVIVAFGNNVAMEDTLEKALADLFPGYNGSTQAPAAPPSPGGGPGARPSAITPEIRSLVQQAETEYSEGQSRLRAGDFAGYGQASRKLRQTLQQLQSAASGG